MDQVKLGWSLGRTKLIFGLFLTAFLAGLSVVQVRLRSFGLEQFKPEKVIYPNRTQLTLTHPLDLPEPGAKEQGLSVLFYRNVELSGSPWAHTVMLPSFDLSTPWIYEQLKHPGMEADVSFALKFSGSVFFCTQFTILSLRSDNGYRIRLKNAAGEDYKIENWSDEVTYNHEIELEVETGWYEIEIDYFNRFGDANFDLKSLIGPPLLFGPRPNAEDKYDQ